MFMDEQIEMENQCNAMWNAMHMQRICDIEPDSDSFFEIKFITLKPESTKKIAFHYGITIMNQKRSDDT